MSLTDPQVWKLFAASQWFLFFSPTSFFLCWNPSPKSCKNLIEHSHHLIFAPYSICPMGPGGKWVFLSRLNKQHPCFSEQVSEYLENIGFKAFEVFFSSLFNHFTTTDLLLSQLVQPENGEGVGREFLIWMWGTLFFLALFSAATVRHHEKFAFVEVILFATHNGMPAPPHAMYCLLLIF